MGLSWSILIGAVIVFSAVSLLLREVACWYWKLNEIVALLREIRDQLSHQTAGEIGETGRPRIEPKF